MRDYTKEQQAVNRAEAMRAVAGFINQAVPKLQARLLAGYKIKEGGCFYKKDKADLDAILDAVRAEFPKVRAYVTATQYSIRLEADQFYNTCESSGNYYKDSAYLLSCGNPGDTASKFERRDDSMTADTILAAAARAREIRDLVSELNSELFTMQLITGDR